MDSDDVFTNIRRNDRHDILLVHNLLPQHALLQASATPHEYHPRPAYGAHPVFHRKGAHTTANRKPKQQQLTSHLRHSNMKIHRH